MMKIEIIFEDRDILVINKPAGVVVNKAKSVKGETLQEWVEARARVGEKSGNKKMDWRDLVPSDFSDEYGTPREIFEKRQGMVHRLDKNTSGVMVFAKNPGALVHLLVQFRERQVEKKYLCLVHGKMRLDEATISAPLGRAQRNRKKFAVTVGGRKATTKYHVLERLNGDFEKILEDVNEDQKKLLKKNLNLYQAGFSLVECWLETGRTHQIRVHMAHVQHPLVGDVTYVGRKRAKIDPIWCKRQFLHANTLELVHPRTNKAIVFKVPLSGDLEKVLSLLKSVGS